MPRYLSDTFRGTKYKVRPMGWRRKFPNWLSQFFLYTSPAIISFTIEIIDQENDDSPTLKDISVCARFTEGYGLDAHVWKNGFLGAYTFYFNKGYGNFSIYIDPEDGLEYGYLPPLIVGTIINLKNEIRGRRLWYGFFSGMLFAILCRIILRYLK